jgi:hypothetical protein
MEVAAEQQWQSEILLRVVVPLKRRSVLILTLRTKILKSILEGMFHKIPLKTPKNVFAYFRSGDAKETFIFQRMRSLKTFSKPKTNVCAIGCANSAQRSARKTGLRFLPSPSTIICSGSNVISEFKQGRI